LYGNYGENAKTLKNIPARFQIKIELSFKCTNCVRFNGILIK